MPRIQESFLRDTMSQAKAKLSQYICKETDNQLAELAVELHIYVMNAQHSFGECRDFEIDEVNLEVY